MSFFTDTAFLQDDLEVFVLAREAGDALLEKLEWLTIEPTWILDAGNGVDGIAEKLQEHYANARVIAIRGNEKILVLNARNLHAIYADANYLPIKKQSIDVLCANFLLPWHADIPALLEKWHDYMQTNGVILLTALGPDTLKECRDLFPTHIIPHLIDMHDLGDLLLQKGFVDPVLEINYFTLTYSDAKRLAHDLVMTGMVDLPVEEIETLIATLPRENNQWAITYEVVLAHAFCPAQTIDKIQGITPSTPTVGLRNSMEQN